MRALPRASERSDSPTRDLPATLQDLLGGADANEGYPNVSFYDPTASLSSPYASGSGENEGGPRQLPIHAFSRSAFANTGHLDKAIRAYPSPYLLQTPEPTEQITPTDVQVACEYLVIRQNALRNAINRAKLQLQQQQRPVQGQGQENGEASGPPASDSASGSANTQDATTLIQPEPLGILKIFARMRERNPMWVVSEKRLRKVAKDDLALAEAERITRLAGLTALGRYASELVPVSRVDERLVADLEGRQYVPHASNAAIGADSAPSASAPNNGSTRNAEEKENAEASTSASGSASGGSSKKKSKKNAASSSTTGNGVLVDAAETVKEAISSILPASSPAATGSGATSADRSKGPTAIVGDVKVEWMDEIKGRGVLATKAVKPGKVIFKECVDCFYPLPGSHSVALPSPRANLS